MQLVSTVTQIPMGALLALLALLAGCTVLTDLPEPGRPSLAAGAHDMGQGGRGGQGDEGGGGGGGGAAGGDGALPTGKVVTLVTGLSDPRGIAVDKERVYFSDQVEGTISSVEKVSPHTVTLLNTSLGSPRHLHVDNAHVYFFRYRDINRVKKTVPDSVSTLYFTGVNTTARRLIGTPLAIYGSYSSQVVRAGKAGGSEINNTAAYDALAFDANHLFATSGDAIHRFDALSTPVPIATGLVSPQDLVATDGAVYSLNGDGTLTMHDTQGVKPATTLASGQSSPARLTHDDAFFYWTASGSGTVAAVPKAGGEVVPVATDQDTPFAIAVDDEGIYWSNLGDGTINMIAK